MKTLKSFFKWIYLNVVVFFKSFFNGIIFMFKIIFNVIKKFIIELFLLLKTFFIGLILLLKYILKISIKISIILYNTFYKIFKFIWKYILKFIVLTTYKILINIIKEIYIFFKSLGIGLLNIIKFIFYEIPKFFLNAISSFLYFLYNKSKKFLFATGKFFKELPDKIKDFIIKKWNNIGIVKYYKNKRERELEVLFIDKNSEDAVRGNVKKTYMYLARNKEGKLVKGYFSALSKLDTHSYLLDEGYEVYKIHTSRWINFIHGESRTFRRKIKNKDLIFWLTQISTYIKSGIPLTDAIKILAKQDKRKRYKKIYDSIIYELTMGESFSKALEKQGQVYPGLLINMIAAAELIGDIESTLDEMAAYYTEVEDTKKSMISALTYPAILIVFAIGVIAFLLIFIIPQFVQVYEQANVPLNPITVFILKISDFLKQNYFFIIIGFIGILIVHKLLYDRIKAYKTFIQYLIMHIPVIGKIIIYKEMNLFAKTFAALNKNNVLLTDSIDILSKITNNEIYKMIMFNTISNLLRGDKMSDSFKNNWAVPVLAYYMITTGESTGELSTMLEKVSDYYQKQQKNIVGTLKTFIEPIMIAFLAIVVGGIILSVIIPMFGLYTAIQ